MFARVCMCVCENSQVDRGVSSNLESTWGKFFVQDNRTRGTAKRTHDQLYIVSVVVLALKMLSYKTIGVEMGIEEDQW